jgi:hypothetical protein
MIAHAQKKAERMWMPFSAWVLSLIERDLKSEPLESIPPVPGSDEYEETPPGERRKQGKKMRRTPGHKPENGVPHATSLGSSSEGT